MINAYSQVPLSWNHFKDLTKENFKTNAQSILTGGATAGAVVAVTTKPVLKDSLISLAKVMDYVPQANTFAGKCSMFAQNAGTQIAKAWNVLPPKAKAALLIGGAILSAISVNHAYMTGEINGKHKQIQQSKKLEKLA